jgi:hypothetical protein
VRVTCDLNPSPAPEKIFISSTTLFHFGSIYAGLARFRSGESQTKIANDGLKKD